MTLDPQLPKISVRGLLMQAFLTGWEKSDKSISQDEYLQSAIQVIEMLQVEPCLLYTSKERISLPAASGTMSTRCWSGMGNKPSKNTRKPCWCPRHWMRSCCCM